MISKVRKKMNTLITEKEAGFTLIELMFVIAIIGILVTIAVPKFGDVKSSAEFAKLQSELKSVQTSLEAHYARNQGYPGSLTTLPGVSSSDPYAGSSAGCYNPKDNDSDGVYEGYDFSYSPSGSSKTIEMDDSGEFEIK